ncbi:hypothetical protein [Streptomyces laculatispora]|uniref:hypothetical protein n=1 Tax=Streptomyces laculatispora TaxID=887464 RepID=UPI001A941629|nr:hypothetical protein [Streptomyces laculatispora]MBO0913932.1 hypothetical protein [Streptomyces laculatispora]
MQSPAQPAVAAFHASIGYDPVRVGDESGTGGAGGDPVEEARGQVQAAERALAGLTSGNGEEKASATS